MSSLKNLNSDYFSGPAPKRAYIIVAIIAALGWWGYNTWTHYLVEKKTTEFRAQVEAQRHTVIGGQVFIVTKNGDSVKLGDVFISVIGKTDFAKALRKAAKQHKTEMEDEDREIATFSAARDKMSDILVSATSAAEIHSATEALKLHNEGIAYFADLKNQTLEEIFDAVDGSVKKLKSSRTDADGKFKIEVDKSTEDFYLFATVRRKIHGQSEPLIWAIEGLFVSNPLLLSNANLFRADNLKWPTLPAIPGTATPPASEPFLRWWVNQLMLLCAILGVAVAAFVWLKKRKSVETSLQPNALLLRQTTNWKDWKRLHRSKVTLLFLLIMLVGSITNINSNSLDYQQHPFAVVIGSVIIPIVAALGVYWWLGRGNKNPA